MSTCVRLAKLFGGLLRSPGTREHILISFRRREKSRFFVKTANWPRLLLFSGALGLVFVYNDSSPLGLLRMHDHNFLFAFPHTTQISMITPHILWNAVPNLWLLLVFILSWHSWLEIVKSYWNTCLMTYIHVAGDTHSRAWIPQFMKKVFLLGDSFPLSCENRF